MIYNQINRNLFLVYIVAMIFYLVAFSTFYAGKMETLFIDKKKGIIRHTLLNCFLSKIEYVKQIDDLSKIEMVKKGAIRRTGDTTRYVIRLRFKDHSLVVFGETFSYYEIQKKYRICIALLQGTIMIEEAPKYLVKDESYDETSPLLD